MFPLNHDYLEFFNLFCENLRKNFETLLSPAVCFYHLSTNMDFESPVLTRGQEHAYRKFIFYSTRQNN